jgi:hypothetical protein
MSGFPFDGWVPFRLHWQESVPEVEWCYLGPKCFTDPFFETTIHFEVQTPFNSLFRFRTPMAALGEWFERKRGLKPTGFIFHLSRCGSTLITQLLGSLPRNVVLSEARVLCAAVRSPAGTEQQRATWMKWLVSALGQPRTGAEQHLFIKFDPVCIKDFSLLRLVFPDVPWIFVYRDPVEVLVSHLRAPAPMMTRGMLGVDCLTLDPAEVAAMDDQEYAARVLGILTEAAVQIARGGGGLLVHYSQLPQLVWGGVQEHFGIAFSDGEVEGLQQVAAFDAKQPQHRFSSDTEAKNKEATERVRQLAARWVMPHYLALEELRTGSIAQFRGWVLGNPAILERLRGLESREKFIEIALKVAEEAGIPLARPHVELAIEEAQMERVRRLV